MVLFTFQASAGVVCESLEFCRAPETSIAPYEVPALTFHVDGPTNWVIGADVWFSSGCQGEPQHTCRGSGFVPYDAAWYLIADIDEQPPAGTSYSIRWIIDGCPDQPCIEGTIGSAPDICSWVAP
jgi:hypothetical protein